MFDKLKALKEKNELECSDAVIRKAEKLLRENMVRVTSPIVGEMRHIWFHCCPFITSTQKEGYTVSFMPQVQEWICDCKHEVFRKDREKICCHILACMYVLEELRK